MSGINKAIILGNIGKDPEIRTFPDGKKVANFSVATSEKWTDKITGEKKTDTQWHSIELYSPRAEVAEKYIKKGDRVYVEGKIKLKKWQDKTTGQEKSLVVIVGDKIDFFNNRRDQANDDFVPAAESIDDMMNDNIPF